MKHTIKALINLYQSDDWQYLNFYGPARSINTITYPDTIELTRSPIKCDEENIFTGKVVFIGMSETSPVEQKDKDIFDTVYTGPSGLKLAGVEIAATAAANLIEDMPVRRLAYLPTFAIIIGWGLFVSVLWRSYMTVIASWITVGVASIYFGLAFYVFRTNAMWYPVVIPLLQMLVGSALAVARNRRDLEIRVVAIRQTLTEWLPADAIERIITSPEIVRKASGLVYATCLHTDVEGFTSISEDMDPINLSSVMNEYFKTIGQPVIRRGGFVSDQTGDSMLAIWAAAEPDVYLRHQACAGALDICAPAETMSFGLEYRLNVFKSEIADENIPQTTTHLLPLSFRFFYPSGFFMRLGATYIDQEVTADDQAQRENVTLVDAEIGYRLPKRYGIFRVVAGNLFDDDFDFQGLAFRTNHPQEELPPLLPSRTISAQITLNF